MIRPIIFNYNMPENSDALFEKLILDGFSSEEIVLVDNGSDRYPAPKNTNFKLPYNVRFTGQAYTVINYLLNFFNDQHYLLITTSGRLLSDVNYKESFNRLINAVNANYGFIATGLLGGLTHTNAPDQMFSPGDDHLVRIYKYQPIVMVVSRRLLELCRHFQAAYFNLELRRGWGIDRELQFLSDLNGIDCFVDRSLPVEWLTNSTHAAGRADEPTHAYWEKAGKEMNDCFRVRYGNEWESLFMRAFRREIEINKNGAIVERRGVDYE